MLTAEKVLTFNKFRGSYFGYHLHVVNTGKNIVSDEEWSQIDQLTHDAFLVKKGLAAASFEEDLMEKLEAACDNQDTINLILGITQS